MTVNTVTEQQLHWWRNVVYLPVSDFADVEQHGTEISAFFLKKQNQTKQKQQQKNKMHWFLQKSELEVVLLVCLKPVQHEHSEFVMTLTSSASIKYFTFFFFLNGVVCKHKMVCLIILCVWLCLCAVCGRWGLQQHLNEDMTLGGCFVHVVRPLSFKSE